MKTYLAGALADEEAIARASDILSARRGVPDGRGLVAAAALDHVLVALAADVDGSLENGFVDAFVLRNCSGSFHTWQTLHVTMGVDPLRTL